jgi:hypothetical protein
LYPPCGEPISVAEHNAKALMHGFKAKDQRGHLAYDYTKGYARNHPASSGCLHHNFIR